MDNLEKELNGLEPIKRDIIKYFLYLSEENQKSSNYFDYIIQKMSSLLHTHEIDDEGVENLIKSSDMIAKNIGEIIDEFNKIAAIANQIISVEKQRDIKIGKVLSASDIRFKNPD